jgi:hypothetical protein
MFRALVCHDPAIPTKIQKGEGDSIPCIIIIIITATTTTTTIRLTLERRKAVFLFKDPVRTAQ